MPADHRETVKRPADSVKASVRELTPNYPTRTSDRGSYSYLVSLREQTRSQAIEVRSLKSNSRRYADPYRLSFSLRVL